MTMTPCNLAGLEPHRGIRGITVGGYCSPLYRAAIGAGPARCHDRLGSRRLWRVIAALTFTPVLQLLLSTPAHGQLNQLNFFSGMTLVNAQTNQDIRKLENGETINLRALPTKHLNIRAEVAEKVDQVVFAVNGNPRYRAETAPPYALAGDAAGKYRRWTPAIGHLSVKLTAFRKGKPVASEEFSFQVVDEEETEAAPEPTAQSADGTEELPLKEPQEEAELESHREEEKVLFERLLSAAVNREHAHERAALDRHQVPPPAEPAKASELPTSKSSGQAGGRISQTFDLYWAGPGEPPVLRAAENPGGPPGNCVSILDKYKEELSIVCSHQLAAPVAGHLLLLPTAVDDQAAARGDAVVLCDLGDPQSPIVKSCRANAEEFTAIGAGRAVVRIVLDHESESALVGRIPATNRKP